MRVLSQLLVRKMLGDEFKYEVISEIFSNDEISKYQQWMSQWFGRRCNKNMTIELNSEWITRHYLATKMILSASVMLTSLEYAMEKNLKIAVPYLSYYAVLTCCRAVIFTLPEIEWGKNLIEMGHRSILKQVKNCVKQLNKDYGDEFYLKLVGYRHYRELFSYKFPANGIDSVKEQGYNFEYDETIEICKLLCEIAQLNSEQIEKYIIKHCFDDIGEWKKLDYEYIKHCFCYEFDEGNFNVIDDEDMYRIEYIQRKQPFPVSLYHTMSEGMVEEFFGAWCRDDLDEESDEGLYDPNCDWRVIFPCP